MDRSQVEKGAHKSTVRPLNPNFAFLALRAAVELDDIINGKSLHDATAIVQLAESLKETTSVIGGSSPLTSLADPLSADLLNRAWERVEPQKARIATVESLVQQANDVASSLKEATPESDLQELRTLCNFCLALSQVATSYQQEERERIRPSHPQRH